MQRKPSGFHPSRALQCVGLNPSRVPSVLLCGRHASSPRHRRLRRPHPCHSEERSPPLGSSEEESRPCASGEATDVTTILVTGGSGGLGSELVPRLAAGHTVRILSRRPRPPSATTEWAQGELATGEGLAEAVAGVDMIVHAASSPFGKTRQVDVEGIRRLLPAAAPATPHLFYISIVGVDRIPFPYYRAKLAAEKLVEEPAVPYTILRATQFHTLIDRLLRNL